ncbi:MAG: M16 family metallopeptidase, partial [Candidatus Binatia bacterium]
EFERKKDEALAELEAEDQSPSAVADREFRKALFGGGPYRSGAGGWKESVEKLGVPDVRSFYQSMYRPERTVLVASGNVTVAEMQAIAVEMLGSWARGTGLPPIPQKPPSWNPEVIRIDRDLTQANLVWGHVGTTRDDPDWYAIQVMNYILGGGGFSSRMMISVRVGAGLAYSVYSYFRGSKLPGSFQVGLQTKSESTAQALGLVEKEIERIRTEPVSDEELSEAKKFLTGSFPLKFDSNGEMVSFYSQIEYYELGLDYPDRYDDLINAVTREDVLRVANEYLRPDRGILVVIGKQAEITLPER